MGDGLEFVGIGHVVNGGDPAIGIQIDGEGGDDAARAAHQDARGAIDVDDFGCHIGDFDAFVRSPDRSGDPPGNIRHSFDRTQRLTHLAAAVGPQRDVRCQQLHQLVDITTRRCGEESLGGLTLLDAVGFEPRPPGLDVAAGPVTGLPDGRLGTLYGLGDFGVAEVEDLLQHEHRALQRAEGLEHDEHRHRYRFGGGDVVGGIGFGQDRLRKPRSHIGFALMPGGTQALHRQVRHYPGKIRLRLRHLGTIVRRPLEPRVLNDVLGVRGRAEDPIGDREEQVSVVGERLLVGAHRVDRPPRRHIPDPAAGIALSSR